MDEFGPLNLQPRPGRQWARRGGVARELGEAPRRRMRATYHRTGGVRHLFAALELGTDKMYGHIKKRNGAGSSWSSAATCAACTRRPADRDRLR